MPGAYSTGRTDAQEDEMIHLRYHSHPCGLALQYLHLLLKQASSNSIRIWEIRSEFAKALRPVHACVPWRSVAAATFKFFPQSPSRSRRLENDNECRSPQYLPLPLPPPSLPLLLPLPSDFPLLSDLSFSVPFPLLSDLPLPVPFPPGLSGPFWSWRCLSRSGQSHCSLPHCLQIRHWRCDECDAA